MNIEIKNTDTDAVDTSTMANKFENMMEKLQTRNQNRQMHLDLKSDQRQRAQLEPENAEFFRQDFTERKRAIEQRLKQINDAQPTTTAATTAQLEASFDEFISEISELQCYVTKSAMFLSDFKVKNCQQELAELTSNCERMRARLLPKKKFVFGNKKTSKTTATASDKVDAPAAAVESLNANAATKLKNYSLNWTLANRCNEKLLLSGAEINGKDVTISNMRNCRLELRGHPGSVQIEGAINCYIYCGPTSRSLFAEHCENTTLAVACQQLRLHSSKMCRIYAHVTCRAVIEDCRNITVGAYNYDYPGLNEDFQQAGLNRLINNYKDVADFNWLSPNVPSPNWCLLEQEEQEEEQQQFDVDDEKAVSLKEDNAEM